jgi:hypothetical protein
MSAQTAYRKCTLLVIGIVCCLSAGIGEAQTVRPLVSELGNPAHGRVEYFNDSPVPLNVLVEAQSFSVSDTGAISYMPLDDSIHLKLSATSFRVPPQQSYYLYYEAVADHSPAWFVIYATFSGFALRTQEGMSVRLELPHTVYLLPKKALSKDNVIIQSAKYDALAKKIIVDVDNTGETFGRVLNASVTGEKHKQDVPGFPLFPQAHRHLEYNWTGSYPPDHIQLEFEHFKVEKELDGAR